MIRPYPRPQTSTSYKAQHLRYGPILRERVEALQETGEFDLLSLLTLADDLGIPPQWALEFLQWDGVIEERAAALVAQRLEVAA